MGLFDTIKSWIMPVDVQKSTLTSIGRMIDRAAAGDSRSYGGTGEVYPAYRYGREALWDLSMNTDVLRITQGSVIREILRNGFEVTESENATNQNTPDAPSPKAPDPNVLRKRMLRVNDNGQALLEVVEECERDLEVYDDTFILLRKQYEYDNQGTLIEGKTRLLEILRADPVLMGLVQNRWDQPATSDEGEALTFCSDHRSNLLKEQEKCPTCRKQTHKAVFVHSGHTGKVYYSSEEMIHASKYVPSKRLGVSPVISVWMKVRTLLFMDKYIMEMYDGQRPPKAILAFKTMNPEKVQAQIDAARERMKTDPHFPVTLGIPNSDNGKDFIQFVDLMKSLTELQHTEVRNELRSQIGAVYGVEPIFQNDVSTGGGLNNEGLQITVTNRAVEWGQELWNRKILPRICEELGGTGLQLTLAPSEEQDESARLQRQATALANARAASELGLTVEWDDQTEEAVIHAGSVELPQQQNPFGGMGGFGGGGTPSFQPREEQAPSGAPSDPQATVRSGRKANAAPLGKSTGGWTNLGTKLKRIIGEYTDRYLNGMSNEAVGGELERLRKRMIRELESESKAFYQSKYQEEVLKVERELDRNFEFGVMDQNAINLLSNQPVLFEAYAGLTEDLITRVNDIIERAVNTPGGVDRKSLEEEIEKATGLTNSRAENIARTETGKVSAAARKNSYSKDPRFPNFRFRHVGPDDHRTTKTSKRIKDRIGRGVSWDEYVQIITEESSKDFPEWKVDADAPLSHYQSRHGPLRVQD